MNHACQRGEVNPGKRYTLCCFRALTKHATQTRTARVDRGIVDQEGVILPSGNLHLPIKKFPS